MDRLIRKMGENVNEKYDFDLEGMRVLLFKSKKVHVIKR